MKVVGISGAQGAGKTSILTELELRGFEVDHFKVSRAVQRKLNWDSLQMVNESFSTLSKFQEMILELKLENDLELKKLKQPGVILTERTFADIFAYSAQWCVNLLTAKFSGLLNAELKKSENQDLLFQVTHWLSRIRVSCEEAQLLCYDGVVLLPFMDHVKFEVDPHRADAASVHTIFERMLAFQANSKVKSFTIDADSVSRRADQVEDFLWTLNE